MFKFRKTGVRVLAAAIAACMLTFSAAAGDYVIADANSAYTVTAPSYGNPNTYSIYVTSAGTMQVHAQNIASTSSGVGKWLLYKGTPGDSKNASVVPVKEYSGGSVDNDSAFLFSSKSQNGVYAIDATASYSVSAGSYYLYAYNTNPYSNYCSYGVSVSGVSVSNAPQSAGTGTTSSGSSAVTSKDPSAAGSSKTPASTGASGASSTPSKTPSSTGSSGSSGTGTSSTAKPASGTGTSGTSSASAKPAGTGTTASTTSTVSTVSTAPVITAMLQLDVGQYMQLAASTGNTVSANEKRVWTTSDADTVSVDANGRIRALKGGVARITCSVTDSSKKTYSSSVYVWAPNAHGLGGSFSWGGMTVKIGSAVKIDGSDSWAAISVPVTIVNNTKTEQKIGYEGKNSGTLLVRLILPDAATKTNVVLSNVDTTPIRAGETITTTIRGATTGTMTAKTYMKGMYGLSFKQVNADGTSNSYIVWFNVK